MTDVYVPTKTDSLAMLKLRRMVALSATLQTRAGLNYTDLFNRGFYRECEAQALPHFIVDVNQGTDFTYAGGDKNYMQAKGSLFLEVVLAPKSGLITLNDQRLESVDIFTGVKSDVTALAHADDPGSIDGTSHLMIQDMSLVVLWEPPQELVDTTGLAFGAIFNIAWGPGEG